MNNEVSKTLARNITNDAQNLEEALVELQRIAAQALEDLRGGQRVRGLFFGNLTVKGAAEVDRHANLLERSITVAHIGLSGSEIEAAYSARG